MRVPCQYLMELNADTGPCLCSAESCCFDPKALCLVCVSSRNASARVVLSQEDQICKCTHFEHDFQNANAERIVFSTKGKYRLNCLFFEEGIATKF